jgi:hypothetical protein
MMMMRCSGSGDEEMKGEYENRMLRVTEVEDDDASENKGADENENASTGGD